MISSRLADRSTVKKVSVITRNYSSGSYGTPTTVYSILHPTYEQKQQTYFSDEYGKQIEVLDIFEFEPLVSGSLPAITPKHFIVEGSNTYEVLTAVDEGGAGELLTVTCRRYDYPGDGF